MPRLTEDEIGAARDVDLLSFLSAKEPHELVRTGTGEWRTRTHGSLVITKRYWYWNRGGVGSPSAIDFLVKVRSVPFIEAAREVLSAGIAAEPIDIPSSPRQRRRTECTTFSLPPPADDNDRLIGYLHSRAIPYDIIERCIDSGTVYEGIYRGCSVCVFVGRDDNGTARFATIRGINTDLKCDVAGSDKAYGFALQAQDPQSETLIVCESAIDVLSHLTLGELHGWEQGYARLSLAGTSHIALESFLDRHREITRVVLHMDSDTAGITGAARIRRRIEAQPRFRHIRVSLRPVRSAKDYSDTLMRRIEDPQERT